MSYARAPHPDMTQAKSVRARKEVTRTTQAPKSSRHKSSRRKKDKGKSAKNDLRNRIQVALAIADPEILKSLLTHCQPVIASPKAIGTISSAIGITTHHSKRSADGIIRYESVQCRLPPSQDASNPLAVDWGWNARDYHRCTQCESGTQVLLENATMTYAQATLIDTGFSFDTARQIIHLPPTAHYKSWWYALDKAGQFSQPFLRSIRTVRFADGTLTLKYKDHFEDLQPPCFHSQPQEVLVEIRPKIQNFGKVLDAINRHRHSLEIDRAVLICDRIDDYDAQGFASQGISLYPAIDLMLPVRANCATCVCMSCALQGQLDSPVSMCRQFSPPVPVFKCNKL
ncbi:MAG: hypothetical protein AAFY57_16045 [Cyanobacteria bacterium J06642_2]